MALDVYFREDIDRVITAVTVAILGASVANGGGNTEYCRGVLDMARAQALAFGVSVPEMACRLRKLLAEVDYIIP